MSRSSLWLRADLFAALGAVVVSICALYVTWDQSQVMRAQQHAAVWPVLLVEFEVGRATDQLFVMLRVRNEGVGPALTGDARLMLDGEPVNRWAPIQSALFGSDLGADMAFHGAQIEHNIIGAGRDVVALRAGWDDTPEVRAAFEQLSHRYLEGGGPEVTLDLCYCSVFDRCWRTMEDARPRPVPQCGERSDFFTQLLAPTG